LILRQPWPLAAHDEVIDTQRAPLRCKAPRIAAVRSRSLPPICWPNVPAWPRRRQPTPLTRLRQRRRRGRGSTGAEFVRRLPATALAVGRISSERVQRVRMDSPQEGDGFEPSVPRDRSALSNTPKPNECRYFRRNDRHSGVRTWPIVTGNRWFESVSLQRRARVSQDFVPPAAGSAAVSSAVKADVSR
jgi:hypothetical protein